MSEKAKSILSYIFGWIGGLIVLFAMKDNERNTRINEWKNTFHDEGRRSAGKYRPRCGGKWTGTGEGTGR